MSTDLIETQVLDNVLPQELADGLETLMLGPDFPWYYVKDVTFPADKKPKYYTHGFSHKIYHFRDGILTSKDFFDQVKNIPSYALSKAKMQNEEHFLKENYSISVIKSFFQVPMMARDYKHDNKHLDTDVSHIVCLYYLNDSTSKTYFFSKDEDDENISFTVQPKKNRVFLFDGRYYHASSAPESGPRVVINFNLFSENTFKELGV